MEREIPRDAFSYCRLFKSLFFLNSRKFFFFLKPLFRLLSFHFSFLHSSSQISIWYSFRFPKFKVRHVWQGHSINAREQKKERKMVGKRSYDLNAVRVSVCACACAFVRVSVMRKEPGSEGRIVACLDCIRYHPGCVNLLLFDFDWWTNDYAD